MAEDRVDSRGPLPPIEQWSDFGVMHQFGFTYPGGAYASFLALDTQQQMITVEIPLRREVTAGGVFRPINNRELAILGMAPGDPNAPKWTWIIPQLRYRFFLDGDLLKELFLMWSMGWDPSPAVLAELAQASREGTEDLERERRIRKIITQEKSGGGGGTVQ